MAYKRIKTLTMDFSGRIMEYLAKVMEEEMGNGPIKNDHILKKSIALNSAWCDVIDKRNNVLKYLDSKKCDCKNCKCKKEQE